MELWYTVNFQNVALQLKVQVKKYFSPKKLNGKEKKIISWTSKSDTDDKYYYDNDLGGDERKIIDKFSEETGIDSC